MENVLQIVPLVEKLLNYGVSTLCTVALLIGIMWHFWKLKPALDAQNQLIANNTLATQALSDNAKSTTLILDKVSDKLIAHDERALGLLTQVASFTEGISYIRTNMADRNSMSRIHERIDEVSDKTDVILINRKLDEIKDEAKAVANQVNKIAGKIGA